jgi:hypothetical protein
MIEAVEPKEEEDRNNVAIYRPISLLTRPTHKQPDWLLFIDHRIGSRSALRRCPSQIQILGHKTPGHHSPPTTLKMRKELVLETGHFSELTWLLARENFIEFFTNLIF